VLWFRPEVVETVTWAGDPRKAVTPVGDGGPDRLNPRKSFEAWQEIVRGTAAPWAAAEISAIAELQSDVVSIVLRKAESLAELSAELQRSNKELEAFSYSVSHDLRAPFRHIVGYSELVQEHEAARLSDRGKRYITTVIDSAREAGNLIDNLLSFSQMGRSSLHPAWIDMDQLAREVRAEVMDDEGAGRQVQWQIGKLGKVLADLAMMRLAVRNLFSNAVKYSRDRGDAARVEVTRDAEKDELIFCVRDNGAGFDMQYVDKLFGVFQRLHRAEEFQGTGIGLANVRRIIARHGGRTWAEGKLHEGAAFYFSLPRSAQAEQGSGQG
jgi:light-regulated signal transduction histidine kinase (bacteriophytochrome)